MVASQPSAIKYPIVYVFWTGLAFFFLSCIHKFPRKDGRDFVFRFYEIKFKKRPYAKFI